MVVMSRKWLRKGALIEVFTDGDWWDAHVIAFNKNFFQVHYVGGVPPASSFPRTPLAAQMGSADLLLQSIPRTVIYPVSYPGIVHDVCMRSRSMPSSCGSMRVLGSCTVTDKAMHYEYAGGDDEDEWLEQNSDRVREHKGCCTAVVLMGRGT